MVVELHHIRHRPVVTLGLSLRHRVMWHAPRVLHPESG